MNLLNQFLQCDSYPAIIYYKHVNNGCKIRLFIECDLVMK